MSRCSHCIAKQVPPQDDRIGNHFPQPPVCATSTPRGAGCAILCVFCDVKHIGRTDRGETGSHLVGMGRAVDGWGAWQLSERGALKGVSSLCKPRRDHCSDSCMHHSRHISPPSLGFPIPPGGCHGEYGFESPFVPHTCISSALPNRDGLTHSAGEALPPLVFRCLISFSALPPLLLVGTVAAKVVSILSCT